jgi:hypothetical protein
MKAAQNEPSHSSTLSVQLMKLNGIADDRYLERLKKTRQSEVMMNYYADVAVPARK